MGPRTSGGHARTFVTFVALRWGDGEATLSGRSGREGGLCKVNTSEWDTFVQTPWASRAEGACVPYRFDTAVPTTRVVGVPLECLE